LECGDSFIRHSEPAIPPVSEWDASVDCPLELLQDHTQWFLEQSSHQCRVEGGPEDSASTQHAEHIRGERRPRKRGCLLIRRSVALDLDECGLAICMVEEIDELRDSALWCAPHRQEQW
jgi:hypothetical protein